MASVTNAPPTPREPDDLCYKVGVTLREALADILTPTILAERLDRRIETEYIVAEALFRMRQGHRDSLAGKAIIAWCRQYAAVWVIEDGDRRLEAPPTTLEAGEAQPHIGEHG